jgi:hypothetical protein
LDAEGVKLVDLTRSPFYETVFSKEDDFKEYVEKLHEMKLNPAFPELKKWLLDHGQDEGYQPLPTKDESFESYETTELAKVGMTMDDLVRLDFWKHVKTLPNAKLIVEEAHRRGLNPVTETPSPPPQVIPEQAVVKCDIYSWGLSQLDTSKYLRDTYFTTVDLVKSPLENDFILVPSESTSIENWSNWDEHKMSLYRWILKMVNQYDRVIVDVPKTSHTERSNEYYVKEGHCGIDFYAFLKKMNRPTNAFVQLIASSTREAENALTKSGYVYLDALDLQLNTALSQGAERRIFTPERYYAYLRQIDGASVLAPPPIVTNERMILPQISNSLYMLMDGVPQVREILWQCYQDLVIRVVLTTLVPAEKRLRDMLAAVNASLTRATTSTGWINKLSSIDAQRWLFMTMGIYLGSRWFKVKLDLSEAIQPLSVLDCLVAKVLFRRDCFDEATRRQIDNYIGSWLLTSSRMPFNQRDAYRLRMPYDDVLGQICGVLALSRNFADNWAEGGEYDHARRNAFGAPFDYRHLRFVSNFGIDPEDQRNLALPPQLLNLGNFLTDLERMATTFSDRSSASAIIQLLKEMLASGQTVGVQAAMFRMMDAIILQLTAIPTTYVSDPRGDRPTPPDPDSYAAHRREENEWAARFGVLNVSFRHFDPGSLYAVCSAFEPEARLAPLANTYLEGPYLAMVDLQQLIERYVLASQTLTKTAMTTSGRIKVAAEGSGPFARMLAQRLQDLKIMGLPMNGTRDYQRIIAAIRALPSNRFGWQERITYRCANVANQWLTFNQFARPTEVYWTWDDYMRSITAGTLPDLLTPGTPLTVRAPIRVRTHFVDADYTGSFYTDQIEFDDDAGSFPPLDIICVWRDTLLVASRNPKLIASAFLKPYSVATPDWLLFFTNAELSRLIVRAKWDTNWMIVKEARRVMVSASAQF